MGLLMTKQGVAQPGEAVDMTQYTNVWQPLGWVLSSTANIIGSTNPGMRVRRFAAIGDSITRGNGGTDGQNNASSWFDRMCIALGRAARKVENAGVPAEFSSQIAARISTDVLADGPDVCFIMSGANDPGLAIALSDTYDSYAKYQTWTGQYQATIIQACLAAGVLPVLVCGPTMNSNLAPSRWLQYGMSRKALEFDIPFIDLSYQLVNPANGQLNGSYSGDGLHPNAAGAKILGDAAAAAVQKLFPLENNALPAVIYDGDPLCLVGATFSSGNTGGIGTGWSEYKASGTSQTPSIVAAGGGDDIVGSWQRLTRSADNGDHGIKKTVSLVAGNTVEVIARIRTASIAAGDWPQVELYTASGSLKLVNGTFAGQTVDGWFVERFVVPTGITTGEIRCYADGSGATGTMDFAQVTVRDVTARGEV